MKAVILAGGSGERFWPLSTPDQPKQFLRMFGDISLLRATYNRLRSRFENDDILIITSKEHREMTLKEIPEIPFGNVIGEPSRMNTGPACMIGVLLSDEGETILTVPADHLIPDEEDFWKYFDMAIEGSRKHGGLFTFGIKPTRPDTGYGYIEMGDDLGVGVSSVEKFKEKPDKDTAQEYMKTGNYLWNSGMFLWKKEDFLNEMEKNCPTVFGPLHLIDPRDGEQLRSSYSEVEKISIDHSLMERSEHVMVVPSDFRWSDVGTWLSIKELEGAADESLNVDLTGSKNILVRSQTDRKIAVIGLKDLMVIDTDDGLLICSDTSAQLVREASRKMNSKPE